MHISQVFLTDSSKAELPPFLRHAVDTVRAAFPESTHTLYDNERLRQFIADHYDRDVLSAYDTLRPYSYKSDLGRYCLLNTLGGWYFDIAIRIVHPVFVADDVEFVAFRDIQRFSGTCWACATTVLFSRPSHRGLEEAIVRVVRNCRERYYGLTSLCPTGPTLLGEALAACRAQRHWIFGDYLELTPERHEKNRAFVMPDGTLLAWGKPATSAGGDLTRLGASGVNNYHELWRARAIYNGP
jgi:mannosyltransferase OCH1-like enzyme